MTIGTHFMDYIISLFFCSTVRTVVALVVVALGALFELSFHV